MTDYILTMLHLFTHIMLGICAAMMVVGVVLLVGHIYLDAARDWRDLFRRFSAAPRSYTMSSPPPEMPPRSMFTSSVDQSPQPLSDTRKEL